MTAKLRVYDKHLKITRDVSWIDFDNKEIMYLLEGMDIVRGFCEVKITSVIFENEEVEE